jgi:hypothetical protein
MPLLRCVNETEALLQRLAESIQELNTSIAVTREVVYESRKFTVKRFSQASEHPGNVPVSSSMPPLIRGRAK